MRAVLCPAHGNPEVFRLADVNPPQPPRASIERTRLTKSLQFIATWKKGTKEAASPSKWGHNTTTSTGFDAIPFATT